MSPGSKSVPPLISKVASGSEVSTKISTDVVYGSRTKLSPSATESPLTVKSSKLVSKFKATTKVMVTVSVVSPSAAVIVIVTVFSPGCRSVSPTTSTVASESVGVATISASVLPYSIGTLSPSATSAPFTVRSDKVASLFRGTTTVTVYTTEVEPSAAVTVTVRTLSPTSKPVSPATSYEASGSVVSKTTSTVVVRGSTVTLPASSTSSPFTWKLAKVTSLPKATFSTKLYSATVPS